MELSVSALSVGGRGSYDVTRVWLLLWQLCIARRRPGVYSGPGI